MKWSTLEKNTICLHKNRGTFRMYLKKYRFHSSLTQKFRSINLRNIIFLRHVVYWTISKIFSKNVLDQLHVLTTSKSCWQPEMSSWIQAAMQQNTIRCSIIGKCCFSLERCAIVKSQGLLSSSYVVNIMIF
jgi:hypothetical protein